MRVAASLVVAAAAPASADTLVVTRGDDSGRSGLVLGGSIDGGNIGCQTKNGDDCGNGMHEAGGFSVHVGVMVAPAVAIIGEVWGMAHQEDSFTASQVLATAAVRAWLAPRVWLQGGVGVARSKLSFDDGLVMGSSESSTVPAAVGALGVELVQTPTLGLDLELRAGSGLYRDDVRIYNAALGVGASFY
jgi:hypothetical protein